MGASPWCRGNASHPQSTSGELISDFWPIIMCNAITSNFARNGGGIYCDYSCSARVSNNVFSRNLSVYGGGIYCGSYSKPSIISTVLWGDLASEGHEIYLGENSGPVVAYCDVEGGWEGEGNIDVEPLFRNPDNGDFHLMAAYCGDPYNSPCIDVGHPDSIDVLLDCFHGLGSDRCDMGAYGGRNSGWPTTADDENCSPIPREFLLLQNYPNPFNATTVIEYELPINGYVRLEIYNMLGQKVATLVDSKQQTGYRTVLWDGSGLSSGLYFYRLTAGDRTETKKMMLVK